MKLDWNRIKRTIIQSASGAGAALISAIMADFSRDAIFAAVVGFVATVAVAVLMNIEKQAAEIEDSTDWSECE